MGGGDQGGASGGAASVQDLLQQMQKQRTSDQIQGAFNQLGKGIGTQLPYMQSGGSQGGAQQAGGQSQAPSIVGPYMPSQGMGGGGIDPQQLAMILQRLGYGGQV